MEHEARFLLLFAPVFLSSDHVNDALHATTIAHFNACPIEGALSKVT